MQSGIEKLFGFRNSEVPVFRNLKAQKKEEKKLGPIRMFWFPEDSSFMSVQYSEFPL